MMSSDRPPASDEHGSVIAVEELGGGLVELTARCPQLARTVRPGQFAQLRCGEGPVPLLRRPFSVAWTDGEICAFVFERVGIGTRRLADLRPGDSLDALGPLGTAFTQPASDGPVLIVAGGLGCAPFPLAAREARRRGATAVTVLHGAATAERLYPADRFARGDQGIGVVEATDDGSRGHHGPVTDLFEAHLTGGGTVWACGPTPMLIALAGLLGAPRAPAAVVEASLEAPMGCGYGTCLGCAVPVRDAEGSRWALCCTDGPVMPIDEVDWERMRAMPAADVA